MTQVFDDVLEVPQDSRHVAQLVISGTGEKHMLVEGENIIGREPSNAVCLSHPSISGENHAVININMEEEGGLAIVSHREGKNKSYYLKNQEWTQLKPKQSYVIKSGTRLRFGHCDVTFELLDQHVAEDEDDTEDEGDDEGAEQSTVPQMGTAELNDDSDDGKGDLANADTLAIVEDSDVGLKGDATQNPMQEATQAPLGHVDDLEDDEGKDEGAETLRPREEVETERHGEVDVGEKGGGEEGRMSERPVEAAGEEQEKENEGEEEEDLLNTTLVEEGEEEEEDGDEVGSAVYDNVDEGAGMKESEGYRASSVSSLGPPELPASGTGGGGMWADDGDETDDEAEARDGNATDKDEDIIDSPTQPPPPSKGQGEEKGDEEREEDAVEEEEKTGLAATAGNTAKPAGEEDDAGSEFDFGVPTGSDVAAAGAAEEDSAMEAKGVKVDEQAGKREGDEHGQLPVSPAQQLVDAAGKELVSPPLPPHVETPAAADAAAANGSAVNAPSAAEVGGAQEAQGGEEAGKPESEDAALGKGSKGNAAAAIQRKPTRGQAAKQQQQEEEEKDGQMPVSPAQQLIDAAGKELVSPPLPPHVETPAAADAAAAATSDAVRAPPRAEAGGAQAEQGGEEAEPESHAPALVKGRKGKAGAVPTRKPTRRQAARQQQQEKEEEDMDVGTKGEADEQLPAADADKDELPAAPRVGRAAAPAEDDSKSSEHNTRGRRTAQPPFKIGKAAPKESVVSAAEDVSAAEVQTSQTRGGRSRKGVAAVADADDGGQKAVRRGGRRGPKPGGAAVDKGEGGDDEASVTTSESSAAAHAGQKRGRRGGANKAAAMKEVEDMDAADETGVDGDGVEGAGKGLEVAEQEAEGESVKERGGGRRGGTATKGRKRVEHDVSFAEQPSEAVVEGGTEKGTEVAEDSVSLEGNGKGQRRGRRGTTSRTAAVKELQAPTEGASEQGDTQAEESSGRQHGGRARGRGKAKADSAAHPASETAAKEASAAGAKASRTGRRRGANTATDAGPPSTTVPAESDVDQSTARAQTGKGAKGRKAAELGVLADDDKDTASVEGDAEPSAHTKKPATRRRAGINNEAQEKAEERKAGRGKRGGAGAVTMDDAGDGEGDTTETDESHASRKQGSRGGKKQKTEFAAPATRARRGGAPAAEEAGGGEESVGVKEEDTDGKGKGRARKRGARADATASTAERDDAKAIKKAKGGDSAHAPVPPPPSDEPSMAEDEGSHADAAEGGKKRARGAAVASVGGPTKKSARGRGVVKEEDSTQESHVSTSSRRRHQSRSSTARGGPMQDSMSVDGDASESQVSRAASRKSAAATRHHVLFSGFSSAKKSMLEKKMKDINCILEENVKKATVVITNDKTAEDGMQWFHRTPNVMTAIAYGIPIVDVSWLADSVNHAGARNVTDEYLASTKTNEDDEGFDLRSALDRAASTKLLAGKCVCVKGEKKLPHESDRADIVAACGGRWSPQGDVQSGEELLLFTNHESLKDDPKLADQVKAIAENAGVPVYPADALFTSVVRQELLLGDPLDLDGGGGGKMPAGAKRKRGR